MSANENDDAVVGPVPSPGEATPPPGAPDTALENAADSATRRVTVGPAPSPGVQSPGIPSRDESPPRRLRRWHRVWPDRDGDISYLLTICVDGRARILDDEEAFQRLVAFLLDSPERYNWFGRRFVVMPDHIHVIAHMGHDAIRLGQWIKALKAVVGGLKHREEICDDRGQVGAPGLQNPAPAAVGRLPSHGGNVNDVPNAGSGDPAYSAMRPAAVGRVPSYGGPHEFTRIKRGWRWQDGYHDHKFRTPESESRKWEYVCLNPVRYGLVKRPEEWPYAGEIFYDDAGEPRLVRGTPPLLESGMTKSRSLSPFQH